jgi:hypothetical protein
LHVKGSNRRKNIQLRIVYVKIGAIFKIEKRIEVPQLVNLGKFAEK